MSFLQPIRRGDVVMIRPIGDGELIVGEGVWLAVEDEAEDCHVLIERVTGEDRQRFPSCQLIVTDTVEERVANLLMEKEEGEAR